MPLRDIKLRYKHLKTFQKIIHYRFRNRALLDQALTPKFYRSVMPKAELQDNERLEFLGDSVLNLTISNYLYAKYPFYTEGQLTKLKSQLVSRSFILKLAKSLNISEYLRTTPLRNEVIQPSNLVCAVEALIAAIYLDGGIKRASSFILYNFKDDIKVVEEGKGEKDYKSLLQEFSLKKFKNVPQYEVVSEIGPEHKKSFKVVVSIAGNVYGTGSGHTKKEAHQSCAREALERLEVIAVDLR